MASKLHHSVLDGVGAVQTFATVYDEEPKQPEPWPNSSPKPTDTTSGLSLVTRAFTDSAGRAFAVPRFLTRSTFALVRMLGDTLTGGSSNSEPIGAASKTSLNAPLSTDRRAVAYRVFDLTEFKSLCRGLGCKVNDLAMLLCSAALERYFRGIGEELSNDLWASMPLNTRQASDGTSGNAVAAASVNLHTTVAELVERLKLIQQDAQASKERWRPDEEDAGLGVADFQAVVSPLILDIAAWLAVRASTWDVTADRLVLTNTIISNVPGPRGAIYVAGARAEHSIPMIPVANNMTLSWGITSFGETLTIGFHACGEAVADKQLLIEGVDEAYAQMAEAAARGSERDDG